MCKQGEVTQLRISSKTRSTLIEVDNCIANIVKALNDAGIETKASCCGHGRHSGNIALLDGRELIIAKDYETARRHDNL